MALFDINMVAKSNTTWELCSYCQMKKSHSFTLTYVHERSKL